jgi:hypothetical protein
LGFQAKSVSVHHHHHQKITSRTAAPCAAGGGPRVVERRQEIHLSWDAGARHYWPIQTLGNPKLVGTVCARSQLPASGCQRAAPPAALAPAAATAGQVSRFRHA